MLLWYGARHLPVVLPRKGIHIRWCPASMAYVTHPAVISELKGPEYSRREQQTRDGESSCAEATQGHNSGGGVRSGAGGGRARAGAVAGFAGR